MSILTCPVDDLCMPFTWNLLDENGTSKEVELIENGLNIIITEQNKFDFVMKVVTLLSYDSIKDKVDSLVRGFYSIMSRELVSIFGIEEFDFIISGQNDISIEDWKNNTVYKGHYNNKHKVSLKAMNQIILEFWDIMTKLSKHELMVFFRFCTGCTKVPVDGFNSLTSTRNKYRKFSIESRTDTTKLIEAMTCFNRIYLPLYESRERLEKVIKTIITNNTEFFGKE